jgi:hypothetical protein
MGLQIAADATDNSAVFTPTSRPSQRSRTTIVTHSSNVNWNANTWYSLNDISGVIQAVVNRSGWRSGNSLSIIVKGTSPSGTYGRKFVRSYESSANLSVRLVITYSPS